MHFSTLIIASIASLAAAQTTSSVACAAQNILDACKATIQSQINSCSTQDYICLCRTYTDLVGSCYSNCPNDVSVGTAMQLKDQYCRFATQFGTTSTLGVATGTVIAAATSSTTNSMAVQSGFATSTTGSGAEASGNSAVNVQVGGSMLAVIAAGFGLLL